MDQYSALCNAIATGATFVKYSDKEIHYMTLPQMLSIKRDMEIDLGLIRQGSRRKIGVYDKGLGGRRIYAGRGDCGVVNQAVVVPTRVNIVIFIKDAPDLLRMIPAGPGVSIYAEYASAPTVTPIAKDATVGVLANKAYEWPFIVNDFPKTLLSYDSVHGTLTGPFVDGDYININFYV